jgi:peptidoglycan/LPS O-acetylase OafA/YrhL
MGNVVIAVLGMVVLTVAAILCGALIGSGVKNNQSVKGYYISAVCVIIGAAIIIYAVVHD